MKRRQTGLAAVEFAMFVGPAALTLLFACIEIGRYLFVYNTIAEATRRGARVAIVTTMDATGQTAVQDAVLAYGSLDNMQRTNVNVQYLQSDGTTPATGAGDAEFVTVSITGLTHSLLIPFIGQDIAVPPFSTTLPTESLGFDPDPP